MSVLEIPLPGTTEPNVGAPPPRRLRRKPGKCFKRHEPGPKCLQVAKPLFKKNREQDPSALQRTLTTDHNVTSMFCNMPLTNSDSNFDESDDDSDAASITLKMENLSLDESEGENWFVGDEAHMSDDFYEEEREHHTHTPPLSNDGTEVYDAGEGYYSDEEDEGDDFDTGLPAGIVSNYSDEKERDVCNAD